MTRSLLQQTAELNSEWNEPLSPVRVLPETFNEKL